MISMPCVLLTVLLNIYCCRYQDVSDKILCITWCSQSTLQHVFQSVSFYSVAKPRVKPGISGTYTLVDWMLAHKQIDYGIRVKISKSNHSMNSTAGANGGWALHDSRGLFYEDTVHFTKQPLTLAKPALRLWHGWLVISQTKTECIHLPIP